MTRHAASTRTQFPAGLVMALIEVPRGSFIKREIDTTDANNSRIEYISPLPSPFNYGQLPGRAGDDGDPEDAVVLGPRLPLGHRVHLPVVAVVHFMDGGCQDPKWVLAEQVPSRWTRIRLRLFFRLYALARHQLNRLAGIHGTTRYLGLELAPPPTRPPRPCSPG